MLSTPANHSTVKKVAKELQQLQQDPPEGIRVSVNDDDLSELQCFILGPGAYPQEDGSVGGTNTTSIQRAPRLRVVVSRFG